MFCSQRELWQEIEATLQQLLRNASLLEAASLTPIEGELLQRTQESLLARLHHAQTFISNTESKRGQRMRQVTHEVTQVRIGRNRKP